MRISCFLLLLFILLSSCHNDLPSDNSETVFSLIKGNESGIDFINTVTETKEHNIYTYGYLYNGGGVAIGDINNDGLSDIYLTSSQGKDQLYLNKGDLKFEEIGASAGISDYLGMKAGVTMIDINNDGWLDIYVSRQDYKYTVENRRNLLFINNKDNTFKESAKSFGIDDDGFGTQATFFDYDNDGDLDLYCMNHPGEFEQPIPLMLEKLAKLDRATSDRLYRNEGNNTFIEVTKEAGILNYAYGLGIATGDLNKDGFIDVYVTSDFAPHDLYYINNGNGTFTESIKKYFNHCSYFAMGCDLVDINNDQNLDLFAVEMLSEDNQRQKTNMAPMDMGRFSYMVNNGFHYQYMRNSFQINNGNGYFSDIAYYCGIDKTDWSWGTLFGDYDNDGDDDLVVVNGYLNDTQDKDFGKKSNELAKTHNNRLTYEQVASLLKSTPIKNYAFENKGDLSFDNVSDKWGFNMKGFSNGVSYSDLDNDGDLDLVVNNINSEALLYRNNSNTNNFVKFKLKGSQKNIGGIHTQLILKTTKGEKYKDFTVTRGFQSSVDYMVHFGLAEGEEINNLKVVWSDGQTQTINDIKRGQVNNLDYVNSKKEDNKEEKVSSLLTKNNSLIDYNHVEEYFNDYKREVLLPHMMSQLGPAMSSGDVNNDGLEDLYIGGSHGYIGALYLQHPKGGFIKSNNMKTFDADKASEDISSLFFDADNDGDLDLYVVSGSNESPASTPIYQDRLYINDGAGFFQKSTNKIPEMMNSGGCVESCDYDKDGDLDLFVGTRLSPGNYPLSGPSHILQNNNGIFTDVTSSIAPQLAESGMISSAVWVDFDGDTDEDLILVGEWTGIMVYVNNNGNFSLYDDPELNNCVGWWNVIKAADLDNDGDLDLVIGNLGKNYKYKATKEHPFEIFSNDFDNNGKRDIALGYYSGENLYPVRGLQCSSEQNPDLKEKFHTYEDFGKSNIYEIYGDELKSAIHFKANEFSSIILRNNNGKYIKEYLPYQAQLAPIKDLNIEDINNDGVLDIIIVGNWYVAEIETPRADNGTGLILLGDKTKNSYRPLSVIESGLFSNKDVRQIELLHIAMEN